MNIQTLIEKYKKYLSDIQRHVDTNKPVGFDLQKINEQVQHYTEFLSDLNKIGAPVAPPPLEFKVWEEVECGDSENFHDSEKGKFLCMTSGGKYVVQRSPADAYAWKYCRKPLPKQLGYNVWKHNESNNFRVWPEGNAAIPDWHICNSFLITEK